MIKDLIKDALYDCIVFTGGTDEDYVYDYYAPVIVEQILKELRVAYNILNHSIPGDQHDEPNMWCAAFWIEAGQPNSFGFNYMTKEREKKLEVFQEIMDNPYRSFYINGH